ncbi:uncharacterized protein DUF1311 [Enterobacter sp. BIGb0383]|uniref:lysozyme inhibitor LprI family protein n=1 Tax=unclassified Enterobacter TaxID=2608935 RepID=UPI000F9F47D0|nr:MULTISPECIES: lysozyme inhibitor LprI family protein [unclassified Enterobacter]ROP63077.1 uncharacterized protein DUF1311 [Enterobacter sp. BIGb0383]ROS13238.1 uncharacterized protein DUF1311 [Enterobacter sp. BIGb0359]
MMFNFSRTLTAMALLTLPASALAMDCTKATQKDEIAICHSPTLLQLDAVLNKSYALARQQTDKEQLKNAQLDWLKSRQQCGDDTTCLGNRYIGRIKTLAAVENISVIHNASKQWDFVLSASGCNPEDSYPRCEGSGMLDVFAKGSGKLVQHLPLSTVFLELDSTGKATTNLVEMYGDNNSGLVIDDMNFDGHDDIALRAGNEGAYGGPSYDVYLYQSVSKRFVLSDALTQLGSENLGLFGVDPERKTLTTWTKSGCCWHQSSVWKVENNQPVLIEEITEDATNPNLPDKMTITTRKLVNGKWQVREKEVKTPE